MENHLVILATPKRKIPRVGIKLFVETLINKKLTKIEYFGNPIDNQADYIDDEMQNTIDNTTYITLHFDYPEIDYDKFDEEETLQLIIDVIEQQKIVEVKIDDKDIDFFIQAFI